MTDSPAAPEASRDVCLVVRRAATFMTPSNTEEGFAQAMERFIRRRPAACDRKQPIRGCVHQGRGRL